MEAMPDEGTGNGAGLQVLGYVMLSFLETLPSLHEGQYHTDHIL